MRSTPRRDPRFLRRTTLLPIRTLDVKRSAGGTIVTFFFGCGVVGVDRPVGFLVECCEGSGGKEEEREEIEVHFGVGRWSTRWRMMVGEEGRKRRVGSTGGPRSKQIDALTMDSYRARERVTSLWNQKKGSVPRSSLPIPTLVPTYLPAQPEAPSHALLSPALSSFRRPPSSTCGIEPKRYP